MKVLVTGGAGFIGSHTAVELQQKGFEIVIIDNLNNSRIEVISSIERITGKRPVFYQADCCDLITLQKIFETENIDAVIHFAAHKAVGESVEHPLMYYRNNFVSLLNLLDCCKKYGTQHIVFSSSCTVYGQPDTLPITEYAPVKQPESPYGNTKKVSEEILMHTTHAENINAISLRYFNPVGAHESALIGEYPLGKPANLMPVITQNAIGKIKTFTVFGTDYPTRDGSNIRDYIHVVDLARAHVIAIERMAAQKTKSKFEIFNIGTGNGISVLEMIHAFERTTGVKLNYVLGQRRAGDVIQVWADTTLANNELGWKATRSLDEMCISAWKWEQRIAELGL